MSVLPEAYAAPALLLLQSDRTQNLSFYIPRFDGLTWRRGGALVSVDVRMSAEV